jgi:tetratricopeptide (TPR) repeat protein
MYCGRSVVVRQAIHQAVTGNAKNWLVLANAAAEAGNHIEAYNFYTRMLEVDPKDSEAWAGKAAAAGWMSTLASSRLAEMWQDFKRLSSTAGVVPSWPESFKKFVASKTS